MVYFGPQTAKVGPEFWPTQRAAITLGFAMHSGYFISWHDCGCVLLCCSMLCNPDCVWRVHQPVQSEQHHLLLSWLPRWCPRHGTHLYLHGRHWWRTLQTKLHDIQQGRRRLLLRPHQLLLGREFPISLGSAAAASLVFSFGDQILVWTLSKQLQSPVLYTQAVSLCLLTWNSRCRWLLRSVNIIPFFAGYFFRRGRTLDSQANPWRAWIIGCWNKNRMCLILLKCCWVYRDKTSIVYEQLFTATVTVVVVVCKGP